MAFSLLCMSSGEFCVDANKARFVLWMSTVEPISREPSSLTSHRRKRYGTEHMGTFSRPFYIFGFCNTHIMKLLRLFKPSARASVSRKETCTKAIRRLCYRYNGIFLSFAWFSVQELTFFSGHEAKDLLKISHVH